jgi:hypothetical protein
MREYDIDNEVITKLSGSCDEAVLSGYRFIPPDGFGSRFSCGCDGSGSF